MEPHATQEEIADLARRMDEADITQRDLAIALDFTEAAVSRWFASDETKRRRIPRRNVPLITSKLSELERAAARRASR